METGDTLSAVFPKFDLGKWDDRGGGIPFVPFATIERPGGLEVRGLYVSRPLDTELGDKLSTFDREYVKMGPL